MSDKKPFQFEISLSVLNHLGRNLYRNFITVLGEAVSNSWDADAKNVWIEIDKKKSTFSIKDDGEGMSAKDFQEKFLKIGYSKRRDGVTATASKRPYIGAKGIGKLALLSCAKTVSIYSKKKDTDYVGGVIDNSELDQAITHDNTADQYPLATPDPKKIQKLKKGHEHGTIIVFDGLKENLKSSTPHLRKLLALSFKFAIIDPEFNLHVDGKAITEADLKELAEATEFMWTIDNYADSFTKSFENLVKAVPLAPETVKIKGFFATVDKPSKLKITGTDERATVDLFVNGRLREKNVLRHIPSQRIVENYLYGQIHFDDLDRPDVDPFTSSREGVIEDDAQFALFKADLKILVQKVIDQWDELRLERGKDGDDENTRKSKKERKALDMFNIAKTEYQGTSGTKANRDRVEKWLELLKNDAAFNLQAYVDCFLSENLIRKYIEEKGLKLSAGVAKEVLNTSCEKTKPKQQRTSASKYVPLRAICRISTWMLWQSPRKVANPTMASSLSGWTPYNTSRPGTPSGTPDY